MSINKSLSKFVEDAKLLASGIRKNAEPLAKRNIGEEQAQDLEARAGQLEALNKEQESLKGRLKKATEELEAEKAALKDEMSTHIKVIKADIPQSLWKEFGIQAKK